MTALASQKLERAEIMAANFQTLQSKPKFRNISPMSLLLMSELESMMCKRELREGRAKAKLVPIRKC